MVSRAMTLPPMAAWMRDLEELAGDELLQLLDQRLAAGVGLVAVDDEREGVDRARR